MNVPLKRRGTLLLLLAVFYAAYGIQILNPSSAAMHLADFDGTPQFTPIDATAIQYATNTSSTILRLGGGYYLWRDGGWFRSSSATGVYWKTDAPPAELAASQRRSTE